MFTKLKSSKNTNPNSTDLKFGQNLNADIYQALREEFGKSSVTPKLYYSGEFDGDFYVFFELELPDAIIGVYAFPPEREMNARRHIMVTAENPNGEKADTWEYTDYDPSMSEVMKSIRKSLAEVAS